MTKTTNSLLTPIFASVLALMVPCLHAADAAPQVAQTSGPADLASLDLESLLNTKVITASKFSQDLADAPGIISVISADELRRFSGITLREILERVSGVSVSSAYHDNRSLVAVRGDQTKVNGGHILFLINGRPTREILEGGVIADLLESFPVSALQKVEVIKGPGSVLYGSNAFTAVVNLITREADHNAVDVAIAGGGQGSKATSVSGTFKRGELKVVSAGQFHQMPAATTHFRFPSPPNNPLEPPRDGPVTLEDHGHGGYLGVNYKALGFMSSFTEWNSPSVIGGFFGKNRLRRGFADLGYRYQPAKSWDMSINATYTRNTLKSNDDPFIGRASHEIVVEWSNSLELGVRDRITFGTLYNRAAGRETYFGISPAIDISNGSRPGAAVYAQLDHQLTDAVKLVAGFQLNKIRGISVNTVPRAGVVWSPTAHISVKALYSGAFRAPSINETLLNHPGLQGNPLLKPEKVATFDLGFLYQANRVVAGINYFHSRQTDSIGVTGVISRFANLGKTTFQGFEIESKFYLRRSIFLSGSVSYQANHDGNGRKNVPPVPNVLAKAGLSYRADNGLTASIFDNYQGAIRGYQDSVRVIGLNLNPNPAKYHLLNAHFRYDISKYLHLREKNAVALYVHANNLTNPWLWLPAWGYYANDTTPIYARTVLFGMEFSVGHGQ